MKFEKPPMIGRKSELDILVNALNDAAKGQGQSIVISGEAGIGKSRLIEAFKEHASSNFSIYFGAATQDVFQPFMLFSGALEHAITTPLYKNEEHKSFKAVFAINHAGLLIAQASDENEEMDGDIFAGMLTAVQAFVSTSIDSTGNTQASLDRLEYGDLKIITEHSPHIFVTAVFSGNEHDEMKRSIRHTVTAIETEHSETLKYWNGQMGEVEPICKMISELAGKKFLVRRDLEGLKLEEERLKIADRILELISSLASSEPVVLILEDLHWADESSLFVYEYLSRNIQNRKIMIMATTRPVDVGPLHNILETIFSHSGAIIPLFGLENTGLGEILDELYPSNSFPDEFTREIIERCEGNPFFFLEILRQLWVDGNVIESSDGFRLVDKAVAIPASIEELIQKRLANLDSEAMAMAEYASCIGKTFSQEEVDSVKSIKEPAMVINRLIDNGLIHSNDGSIEFSHSIYQDIIYSGISDNWKSTYHKHLGEYYESVYENRESDVIYQLARHFFRSREHKKAFDYSISAGEKAELAFAAEQALGFYKDALSLICHIVGQEKKIKGEKDLALRIGDLLVFTGQFDIALGHYESVLLKENNTRKKADIYRKIAEIYLRRGEYQKCNDSSKSGLKLLDGELCIEAEKLYNTMGWAFIKTGKHEEAMELLVKSLEIATDCNDYESIASAEHNIGSVMLHKGEYQPALVHFEKALSIKDEIGDMLHLSSTLNNMGNSYMGLGDLLKSLHYYERSVENSRTIGDNRALSISLTNMGNIVACLGDLNKAMDYYRQSQELKIKFDDKWGLSTILENIGTVHFSFGEMDKALEKYQESLAIRESINDTAGISLSHINMGEAYHYTDHPEKALFHYRRGLEIATETGEKWLVIIANYRLAESLLSLGKAGEASEYVEIALAMAIETRSKPEEARSRQALGKIHVAEGNFDLAKEEYERVKMIFEETHEKGEMAKLVFDYATLHQVMGEINLAKQEFDQAMTLFEETGAKFFVDKCRKKLDEML